MNEERRKIFEDWLKHQYYDLGRSMQDIANELGVSMIRIRKSLDRIESISEEKEAESIADVPPSKILAKRAYKMSEEKRKGFDRDREIKEIEEAISKTPEGNRKNKLIELKNKFELQTRFIGMSEKNIKTLEEIVKNDEDYKVLLERKKAGESVEDLIKGNRNHAEILAKKDKENIEEAKKWQQSEEGRKWFEDTAELRKKQEVKNGEVQRKIQTWTQLENMAGKSEKYLQDFMKNEMEYKNLSEREKAGESVEDLIKQNRIYVEEIRRNFIKTHFEAKEFLRMNPDWFQNPLEKRAFLMAFRLSHDKNKKHIRKEKKKKKSQKCPNCRIMMNYLEDLDGYRCPKCKKKFYLWEKKLNIMGDI